MEDDTGLELSLGLCCGGSSGKSKIKEASSDPKADEGGSNRLMGGNMTVADSSFKNFFQAVTGNQDLKGKQKTVRDNNTQQNFWTDLGKCSTLVTDHSNDVQKNITQFNRYQELWASNRKTADTEEEKSNKRKMPFEEINFQNKHEKVAEYADTHGKIPTSVNLMRNSHASVTTEAACAGVNEDVAESEAEGSNSWLLSQHEEKSKSSDIPKFSDKYVASESSVGQKESAVSGSESNQELGKVAYGIPLLQPLTVMTVPYPSPVKVPTNTNTPNATGFSSPCARPQLPVTNSERPAVQTMNTSNLQLPFGYSPVQLPTLETGSSWAFNSPVPRHVSSSANRDGAPNTENSEGLKASQVSVQAPRSSSSGTKYENKSLDLAKGGNHVAEIGSSAPRNEGQSKGAFPFFRQKEKTNQSVAEGSTHEGSTIRPGIAPDVKFGGSGSYPDLPWVSTSAPGPNGRTISGVTYKYNQNEVRIICACHGTHMTPEKFVQHASADMPNPDNSTVLASFPSNNPAASAKS